MQTIYSVVYSHLIGRQSFLCGCGCFSFAAKWINACKLQPSTKYMHFDNTKAFVLFEFSPLSFSPKNVVRILKSNGGKINR